MQRIVYVDTSTVHAGKLEELKAAMKRLAAFVETNAPRVVSYGFYLDETQEEMTVVAVHPDSASLASHLDVGVAEFRKFAGLIDLVRIDVYGRIDAPVLERLHKKAQMLGRGTVSVHAFYAGFARQGRNES